MKQILLIITFIGFIIGTIFFLKYIGLMNYQFFAPKREEVRREVWENTPSYVAGMRRDFDNLVMEYNKAQTPEAKETILQVLKHRAGGVPQEHIPLNVKSLINNH